jgi:hypothetical protein
MAATLKGAFGINFCPNPCSSVVGVRATRSGINRKDSIMAVRMATHVRVETSGYLFEVLNIEPKRIGIGKDAPQKMDTESRLPIWSVDVIRTDLRNDNTKDVLSVSLPAQIEPAISGPVAFTGLEAGSWVSGESAGRGGMFFRAEEMKPANKPNTTPAHQS